MPGYLRDPVLHDQVMKCAEAEAEVRRLSPAFDAAVDAGDIDTIVRLSGPYHRAAGKAQGRRHRLGLTPLGRAEGYPHRAA